VLYNTVKDFQSGIVGILGFSGVIIALLVNAHLAQVTRDEQIKQTQLTIQTALGQELLSIQEELQKLDGYIRSKPVGPIQYTLEQPYVYRTVVKDIGVLEPNQAKDVIRVYRDLYLIMNSLRGLAKDTSKPVAILEPKNFAEGADLVASGLHMTDLGIKALAK
jgi:hypothetical protein